MINTGQRLDRWGESLAVLGDMALVQVDEQLEGDLNADGDAQDSFAGLWRDGAVTVTSVPVVAPYATTVGGRFALVVYEYSYGFDLNGDRDLGDAVVVTLATNGTWTSTGLAAPFGIAAADGLALLAVSEAQQGARDLNGDGDALDDVLHSYDTVGGSVRNLGLAVDYRLTGTPRIQNVWFNRQVAFVAVSEEVLGDRNGDGDGLDHMLVRVVLSSGAATVYPYAIHQSTWAGSTPSWEPHGALGRPADPDEPCRLFASTIGFLVSEGADGRDHNTDGDLLDRVVYRVRSNGTATGTKCCALEAGMVQTYGGVLVVARSEASEGRDLNADGVLDDTVPFTMDPQTGALVSLGVSGHVAGNALGLTVFGIAEQANGRDLTGDGDLLDTVLTYRRAGTPGLNTLSLAVETTIAHVAVGVDRIAFAASEARTGRDLNGDGDQNDQILHLHHAAQVNPTNLGHSVYVVYGVRGDSVVTLKIDSTVDVVVSGLRLETGIVVSTSWLTFPGWPRPNIVQTSNRTWIGAEESQNGDLDGDGIALLNPQRVLIEVR